MRTGLKEDLGDNSPVVGDASPTAEAVDVVDRTKPDLVPTDLHMLVRRLRKRAPTGEGIGDRDRHMLQIVTRRRSRITSATP